MANAINDDAVLEKIGPIEMSQVQLRQLPPTNNVIYFEDTSIFWVKTSANPV